MSWLLRYYNFSLIYKISLIFKLDVELIFESLRLSLVKYFYCNPLYGLLLDG